MPKAIAMIARRDFTCWGFDCKAGERFMAEPIDAARLRYRGLARFELKCEAPPPPPPVFIPEPEPVAVVEEAPKKRTRKTAAKRKYQRRDMTADATE